MKVSFNPWLATLNTKNRPKKVMRIETNCIYPSIQNAATRENIPKEQIRRSCKIGKPTEKGVFAFLDANNSPIRIEYAAPVPKLPKKSPPKVIPSKPVQYYAVYGLETDFSAPLDLPSPLYIFDSRATLASKLGIPKAHIREVCGGKRQHIEGHRIAYWDTETLTPILTPRHLEKVKKVLRRVIHLNDEKIYDNQTKAGAAYGIDPGQVGQCCAGKLKGTWNKDGVRHKFAFVDENNQPILTPAHQDSEDWRGTEISCPELGKSWKSIKVLCKEMGMSGKQVQKLLDHPELNTTGYNLVRK